MQLTTTGNLQTDRDQYIRVIEAKTAALFAAACEIGPLLAGATPEVTRSLGEYGLNLGIAFQIADDALDYDANLALRGKAIGDDFREGKMTAPVILALEKADATELSFWQRSLGDLDQREADLATAQKILEKHNAIEESLDIAASYGEKARLALAEAPDHTLRALLDDLVDYSIRRKN